MLRKHLLKDYPAERVAAPEEKDIAALATVWVTSEAADYPIDNAFDNHRGPGGSRWVAGEPGPQRLLVAFDAPQTLRLLRLPKEVKDLLAEGRLDAGHGRALLALERADEQTALGREAARKGLSVREVERRVAQARAPRGKAPLRRDPNVRAAEEKLRAVSGARVEIKRRGEIDGNCTVLTSVQSQRPDWLPPTRASLLR